MSDGRKIEQPMVQVSRLMVEKHDCALCGKPLAEGEPVAHSLVSQQLSHRECVLRLDPTYRASQLSSGSE